MWTYYNRRAPAYDGGVEGAYRYFRSLGVDVDLEALRAERRAVTRELARLPPCAFVDVGAGPGVFTDQMGSVACVRAPIAADPYSPDSLPIGHPGRVPVAVVLWDFGDTLVDERWMRRAPSEFPDWANAWNAVMETCADDWNIGRATERDVFAEMSRRTGLSLGFIERHADACCRSITFHPFTWGVAIERRRPQALVTVNPDLFVERVARRYGLAAHFDTVVVSCSEGTDDKTTLCALALDRLGFGGGRSDALLIDNRRDLAEAWQGNGGAAYVYRGDEAFEADLPTLLG